jgi:hypothetical protein
MNQLAAQACQVLTGTTARALISAGTVRCPAGLSGSLLAGDVPPSGLAPAARLRRRDIAVIQVLAGRPW